VIEAFHFGLGIIPKVDALICQRKQDAVLIPYTVPPTVRENARETGNDLKLGLEILNVGKDSVIGNAAGKTLELAKNYHG